MGENTLKYINGVTECKGSLITHLTMYIQLHISTTIQFTWPLCMQYDLQLDSMHVVPIWTLEFYY